MKDGCAGLRNSLMESYPGACRGLVLFHGTKSQPHGHQERRRVTPSEAPMERGKGEHKRVRRTRAAVPSRYLGSSVVSTDGGRRCASRSSELLRHFSPPPQPTYQRRVIAGFLSLSIPPPLILLRKTGSSCYAKRTEQRSGSAMRTYTRVDKAPFCVAGSAAAKATSSASRGCACFPRFEQCLPNKRDDVQALRDECACRHSSPSSLERGNVPDG